MSVLIQERSANSLSYVRPVSVAYIRRQGPIGTEAPKAWADLRQHIETIGVSESGDSTNYGLIHGKLENPDEMIFDACVEFHGGALPDGLLAIQTIPGGVHLSSGGMTDHGSLAMTLAALLGDPLIGHGLSIAEDRPAIVTYACNDTPASTARSLTLHLPLCWASGSRQGQAA